jgi:hypothetical protein
MFIALEKRPRTVLRWPYGFIKHKNARYCHCHHLIVFSIYFLAIHSENIPSSWEGWVEG